MQTKIAFPQSLTEKYRPETLDQFVGLAEAKRQAQAIIARPIPNSAYLFCGESGTGKTTMALAISRALRANVHHVAARQVDKATIERIWESAHYSNWSGFNWHVAILDEADLWAVTYQDMMLSIWDSMGSLEAALLGDWTPKPPQILWLCTTNCDHRRLQDDSRWEPRFLSRLRIVPFSSYGMADEIAVYLNKVWHAEGGNGNTPNFARLVKDQHNNIRGCLNALEMALWYPRSE